MRYDKLVEMVKRVGKERLGESNHSARYSGSKSMSGRYRPGNKLAQEASEEPASAKVKQEVNLNPKLISFVQDR